MADKKHNSIQEFYRDRSLFITGASGFMGKVLVEKLLYSCSDVKQIYILMRPKRGKSVEVRMDEMFKLPMFERIRNEKPHVLKKVIALQGDLTMDGLGLTEEAKEKLNKEVSVVFHGGATLKLESNLKDAVEMNTTGTWSVLEICKRMKKLEAFVHLSTAFCHPDLEVLEEQAYDFSYNPEDIMKLNAWMDVKHLDKITKDLIYPHPNAYTFTKRLAERLVIQEFPNMPTCIVRPSIVTPSYRDPVPGWVDSLNGPVGVLAAAGKGVLRSMHGRTELHAEVIPVDFAINGIIAIGKKTALEKKPAEIPVYNLTQGDERRMSWGEFLGVARDLVWQYPSHLMLWYPGGEMRKNYWIHKLCVFFFHWIPAYFIDFLFFLFRQKRFMIRVQNRISLGLELLQYFTNHQWRFRNQKFLQVVKDMSPNDKEIFFIDFKNTDINQYFTNSLLGARVYCFKEPLETLPRARILIRVLYVLDRLVRFMFFAFIIRLIISWSDGVRYVLEESGRNLKNVPFARNFVS